MSETYSKVSVVGLGYIGLPTAAMIASQGVEVIGVDVSQKAIDTINSGAAHIVEPDLDALVAKVVADKKLRATLTVEPAQAFVIAVPTPFKEGYEPDLSYIKKAALSVAPRLVKGNLVVLESTSPVGATEQLAAWLAEARPDLTFPSGADEPDVHIAYCPERVLPGHIIRELKENDRIIGGLSAECAVRASALYRLFVTGEILVTNARTAEMAKLTENAFRDVNIAFANELSLVCEKLAIDVWELINLANHHPRVNVLKPGPGVGGHCIAVDPWFIIHSAPAETPLMKAARTVNDGKPGRVADAVATLAAACDNPVIACFGLAYKPDIDDLRESPAVRVVELLAQKGIGTILAVEPHIDALPKNIATLPGVEMATMEEALKKATVGVLLVDHAVFKRVAPAEYGKLAIVDTRGIWR